MKKGFTLIELLVVVLIIGILSAIALPQYQKAVEKARLVEVELSLANYMKAIDMYMLANSGYPSSIVYFSGTNSIADIDVSGTSDGNYTETKLGKYSASCSSSQCTITFLGQTKAFFSDGLYLQKSSSQFPEWTLFYVPTTASPGAQKIVCDWWKSNYSADRIFSGVTACD